MHRSPIKSSFSAQYYRWLLEYGHTDESLRSKESNLARVTVKGGRSLRASASKGPSFSKCWTGTKGYKIFACGGHRRSPASLCSTRARCNAGQTSSGGMIASADSNTLGSTSGVAVIAVTKADVSTPLMSPELVELNEARRSRQVGCCCTKNPNDRTVTPRKAEYLRSALIKGCARKI
jgi:hypothetical protein